MISKVPVLLLALPIIAFSLTPGKDYYCVQLASSKNPERLMKLVRHASSYPNLRIERINGTYTLRAGFFEKVKDSKNLERVVRSAFKDAFTRVCSYKPERVVFPKKESPALEKPERRTYTYEVGMKLSRLYLKKKDFKKAEELYRDLLKVHPNNREIKLMLARVLYWQKKYDEALELYRELEREDNRLANERRKVEISRILSIADRLEKEGKIEEAIKVLERLYKEERGNYSVGLKLGKLYIKRGLRNRAHEVFGELVLKYPKDKDIKYLYRITSPREVVKKKSVSERREKAISSQKKELLNYARLGARYFWYSNRDFEDKELYLNFKLKNLLPGSLIGTVRVVNRFRKENKQLGLEYYRKLFPKWWGYLSSDFSPEADFLAKYSFGGGVFRSMKSLEVGGNVRYMRFKNSEVLLLIPSVFMYLPLNMSNQTSLYINPKRGTYTLLNKLYYTGEKLESFVSLSMGTSSERLEAREDFLRYSTLSISAGFEYDLSKRFSLGGSFKFENRKELYKRYGIEGYARFRW